MDQENSLRDCLKPPANGRPVDPHVAWRALEDYALRSKVEVLQANLRDPRSAMFVEEGVLGTIGRRGMHNVVFVDENQTIEEKVLTLAHELSHVQLEVGTSPPASGVATDTTGQLEPRAYGAEYLFAVATGYERPAPASDPVAEVAAEVGLQPAAQACAMAKAVESFEDHPAGLILFEQPAKS